MRARRPALPVRLARLALAAALALAAPPGRAGDFPLDRYICVAPVPAGPAGGSDFGGYTNTEDPQFIPGYPTPMFQRRHGGATFLTAEGRLMPTERAFGPPPLGPVYRGRDSEVYYNLMGRGRYPPRIFDRAAGLFRDLRPDETERQAEADRLANEIAGYESEWKGPSVLGSGQVFPTGNRKAIQDIDDPAYGTQPWWISSPSFGMQIEAQGDSVRISRDGHTVRHTIPGIGRGNWYLTELPRSGRALLIGGWDDRMLLIDADLNLTRPAGDWRVGHNPRALFLPETGEALIPASDALYWLRDTRLSGADVCGDTAPPPVQPMTLADLPGAEVLAPHPGPGGYLSIRGGEAVLFTTWFGIFELGRDGTVRRIEPVPEERFNKAYPIPGTDEVLVNGCDHALVFDGAHVRRDTGRIAEDCVLDLRPLARNPATGTIWLDGGQRLTAGGDLLERDGAFRPVATPAWLDAPLIGFSLWGADDRLVPLAPDLEALYKDWQWARHSDVSDFWTDAARFEFLIGMRRGFVRFGPDLALTPMPGQPERYADFGYNPIDVIFDPGSGPMLAGTRWDLLAITADGGMTRVPCRDGCDYGRVWDIAPDPGDHAGALVATEAGVFRFHAATGDIAPLLPVERTGSVHALRPVPWLNVTLLDAGFGTFTWSPEQGLRRLVGEGGARRPPHLVVVPAAGRILTATTGAPRLVSLSPSP